MKTFTCEEFELSESKIDTEYFGIPSAKAILKKPCIPENKQEMILDFIREFEFVMISNKINDPINNRWIGQKTSAFLVDINIQLRKELSIQVDEDRSTGQNSSIIADKLTENRKIVHIAETSFMNSQFLNDPYLPEDKARRIYGDIVKNAFGKPGSFFVVTSIADVVAGFILFSLDKKTSSSTIQLIAVDQGFTKLGIGHTLIQSMENYVFCQGIRNVLVGTQMNNLSALKFYNSKGYTYSDFSSIYHYWPMKG